MTLQNKLKDLIVEFDRVHPNGSLDAKALDLKNDGFHGFVNTAHGQRTFTTKSSEALRDVAGIIYDNDSSISARMEFSKFFDIVRFCVADLHTSGKFALSPACGIDQARTELRAAITAALTSLPVRFTHYFPCWTLGMERENPFLLGPVTFMTVAQWINSVDFSPDLAARWMNASEANAHWKEHLRNKLANPETADLKGLADDLYVAVRDCPSIVKVTLDGYEQYLSRKAGEIVCKTALDALSLLFGLRNCFFQQALGHERLPPMKTHSILEFKGHLWPPGSEWGRRARTVNDSEVQECLKNNADWLAAAGTILDALVNPTSATHPHLTKRWTTALDWFAEGQRERSDAMAVAKIGASLDVLSCGGRSGGILAMALNITGRKDSDVVVKGRSTLTFKQVVDRIYGEGRSQILHGTEVDRLKSFEELRGHASELARIALLMTAERLQKFTGTDSPTAFRTMPA